MPRRKRIDTIAGTAAVVAKSRQEIKPPKHVALAKADLPFFDSIIDEYARSEWSEHALEMAALLARTMADYAREQELVRVEGSVQIVGNKPTANPRTKIIPTLAATILSMRRSLALHARGKGGETRDVVKRREIAKAIENEAYDDGSDLLGGC